MWQCRYGKEPFDLKLFMLRCIQKIWWIVAGTLIGALCIGGIYYLKNVTFGGRVPYVITKKLFVEYANEPNAQDLLSFYTAYTWNDWVKSDVFTEGLLERLGGEMTKEEVIGCYEMTLPSDLEMPYIVIRHKDESTILQLAESLEEQLAAFAEQHIEIDTIEVIDTSGPKPDVRDIRTFRAVVLGAVVGTFFALFGVAFKMVLEEGVFLPETFTYRYRIPAVGYINREGQISGEVKETLKYVFCDKEKIGITSLEEDIDLTSVRSLFGGKETVCIPSLLQVPQGAEFLRRNEGNLLLVKAGCGNGKAIEGLLHLYKIHDIPVTAVLLIGADERLIKRYRFHIGGSEEEC